MGLASKRYSKKLVTTKHLKRDKNPAREEPEKPVAKKEEFLSKKTIKARGKKALDMEDDGGIEEALQEMKAEARRAKKKKLALETAEKIKAKGTHRQQKVAAYKARKAARGADDSMAPRREVFVGNLPHDLKEDSLRLHFAGCGEITDFNPIKNAAGWPLRCKGYGFISFKDEAGVEAALKLDGLPFAGRELKVSRAKGQEWEPKVWHEKRGDPKHQKRGNPDFEVMFGNLALKTHKCEVKQLCKDCGGGEYEKIDIPCRHGKKAGEHPERHLGIAYVTYKTEEAFKKALACHETKEWRGRKIGVWKKGCEPKADKEAHRAAKEAAKAANAAQDAKMTEGDEEDEEEEEEEEEEET